MNKASITNKSKLEQILDIAKKNGASQAEIIQKSWTENPINFENNRLKTLESNESSGISVRVIKNNKIGISSSTNPDEIERAAISAIEASEFGPEATFEFSKETLNSPTEEKSTNLELPLENLVERGTNAIEFLRTFHKDILISGGFNLGHGETLYLNSNGISGKRKKSIYSSNFYAHLVRGEDFLGIYDGNNSLDDFPNEKDMCNKIFEKLNFSKETISMTTKKYPVIFTPQAAASIFIDILAVLLNGKVIEQQISPLIDKLDKKVFDEKLSLVEDPFSGTQKADFDDEGMKTKKKDLIKSGIVNSFYFDLNTASKMNKKQNKPVCSSTGNGFKGGLAIPPSPSLTSIQVKEGKIPLKDMIKSIKEGILIDQVLGAGQSNTLAGEFNVGIDLGFKIKDGNIQGRIKNCMVAGNIFELLKDNFEISSDREWVSGSELIPAFFIHDLTVAGK